MNKRNFLKNLALTGIASSASFQAFSKTIDAYAHIPPVDLAKDEDFWSKIRDGYKLKQDYINLENGFYGIQPKPVLQAFQKQSKLELKP